MVGFVGPGQAVRMLAAAGRYQASPAAGAALAAIRWPDRAAVIDEDGEITFAELDADSRALAAGLHRRYGLGPGRRVAVMCRNHRGFVIAAVAGARLGCDVVFLNTGFSAPQLGEVLERERADAALVDAEFLPLLEKSGYAGPGADAMDPGLRVTGGDAPAPARPGRMTLLTSGTTGTPKGAPRDLSLAHLAKPFVSLLSTTPLRVGDPMLIAPPLFHALGLMWFGIALTLGCPMVLLRRFRPEAVYEAVERHRVRALIAVPIMLDRLLRGEARGDTSSLAAVVVSGSALRPDLAAAFMDEFGDIVYNIYGSTETGWGAIATPADMRAAPGTVGRPPYGATVRILDEDGGELPPPEVGRVFVGGGLNFAGYSGGGSKEVVRGLMSTGDLGHFDAEGRLFIDSREDDMIVSGGENVYPREVEDLLARHEDVADVAVLGRRDEEYGERLAAFVVRRPGSALTAEELKDYVRANLARYKVPRDVEFVDELPRTATGKVAQTRLR
ncbi:hypothetical protein D5H75_30330 [Bailinhaonella thermotolerans]|uniref:Acyl-CoA synthetase n=2 Tax=Bailinhaonella thermotolerans TaxID=1070861 RepID=A0A3A4ABS7_9ACTN|nr:hypothetical protein D5H75_30330 [Bailinhaonella thermotolerans]